MTTHDRYHTDARKYAYELREQQMSGVPPEEDPPATADEVQEISQAVQARWPELRRLYRPRVVRAWLQNPDLYSPFIDELAVELAVDFHRSAWEGLTRDERSEAVCRLVGMADPFEVKPDEWNAFLRWVSSEGTDPGGKPVSERRRRWLSWAQEERDSVIAMVARERESAQVAA